MQAKDLQVGDLVDLEGDEWAADSDMAAGFPYEYARVEEVVDEGSAILVHFEGFSIGFPPYHWLKVERTPEAIRRAIAHVLPFLEENYDSLTHAQRLSFDDLRTEAQRLEPTI